MNISEAQNVSTLLGWLLFSPDDPPTNAQARAAAAALADRAYSALHAGIDGADARALWPEELPDLSCGALSFLRGHLLDLPDDDEPSGPPVTTTGDRL